MDRLDAHRYNPVMTAGEYVSAFASIILALAVTDLATSLHRMLRARARVRWDWLPLAVALLILLATVQYWWVFFDMWNGTGRFRIGEFLPDFLTLLLLFFTASAALPDDVPAEGLDLASYYFDNRTYFWTLFGLLVAATTAAGIVHRAAIEPPGAADVAVQVLASGNVLLLAFAAALILTRRRWVHAALVLFMLAALVWQWLALTIAD